MDSTPVVHGGEPEAGAAAAGAVGAEWQPGSTPPSGTRGRSHPSARGLVNTQSRQASSRSRRGSRLLAAAADRLSGARSRAHDAYLHGGGSAGLDGLGSPSSSSSGGESDGMVSASPLLVHAMGSARGGALSSDGDG